MQQQLAEQRQQQEQMSTTSNSKIISMIMRGILDKIALGDCDGAANIASLTGDKDFSEKIKAHCKP